MRGSLFSEAEPGSLQSWDGFGQVKIGRACAGLLVSPESLTSSVRSLLSTSHTQRPAGVITHLWSPMTGVRSLQLFAGLWSEEEVGLEA